MFVYAALAMLRLVPPPNLKGTPCCNSIILNLYIHVCLGVFIWSMCISIKIQYTRNICRASAVPRSLAMRGIQPTTGLCPLRFRRSWWRMQSQLKYSFSPVSRIRDLQQLHTQSWLKYSFKPIFRTQDPQGIRDHGICDSSFRGCRKHGKHSQFRTHHSPHAEGKVGAL